MNSGEDSAFPIISSSSSASHEYEGSVSMSSDSSWKIAAEVSKLSRRLGSKPVRGLCIATGQYSSLCMSAVVLFLGDFDHMEVDEQDREQVDSEGESKGAREEGRRQSKETTNAQTCDDMCKE